jgi:hypothetical protein
MFRPVSQWEVEFRMALADSRPWTFLPVLISIWTCHCRFAVCPIDIMPHFPCGLYPVPITWSEWYCPASIAVGLPGGETTDMRYCNYISDIIIFTRKSNMWFKLKEIDKNYFNAESYTDTGREQMLHVCTYIIYSYICIYMYEYTCMYLHILYYFKFVFPVALVQIPNSPSSLWVKLKCWRDQQDYPLILCTFYKEMKFAKFERKQL